MNTVQAKVTSYKKEFLKKQNLSSSRTSNKRPMLTPKVF